MAKKVQKKVVKVRAHPMRVPISQKNPKGVTIRDEHSRRLEGTYLGPEEIEALYQGRNLKGLPYPAAGKLDYPDSDKYDVEIAFWTDYFNKKFSADPLLDPDIVKALLGSESGFRINPPENKLASGIAQITPNAFKALKDSKGEVKEFIFTKVLKKDLLNPQIAIPMAIRWLFRKKRLAEGKLGRPATAEEIILEYKGLLKSKSKYKSDALLRFKDDYGKLKKK
jgi:hypothetical protein